MLDPDKDKTVTVRKLTRDAGGEQQPCEPYLLVLSGNSVGRVFKLAPGKNRIGRSVDAEILLDDDGISRLHCQVTLLSPQEVQIEDLGSTNGTHVDGQPVKLGRLCDGQKIQLGSSTILKYACTDRVEEQFVTKLYESATRDGLTRAHNKSFLLDCLAREFAWHQRHAQPLSLVLFDIDHFKQVNDTHGHPAGDLVLAQFSRRCREQCRTEDVFARYGGEEFALLLRQTTQEQAAQLAERVRAEVAGAPFDVQTEQGALALPITVSLGVATLCDENHADPAALLEAADQRLYQAKQDGRNRVVGEASGPH